MSTLGRWAGIAILGACAIALGCGGAGKGAGSEVKEGARAASGPTAIRYEVSLASVDPWVIDVAASFEGGVKAGVIALPPAVSGLSVEEDGAKRTPAQHGRSYQLDCAHSCIARYRFDLSGAAEMTEDAATVAIRSGGDLVTPTSVWLIRPTPVDPYVNATLRVDTRDPKANGAEDPKFAAPFPRDEATGLYRMVGRDLGQLGYTAWGSFTTVRVQATQGTLEAAVLRGARRADDATIERWLSATARALDTVYGRFPIDRVLVVVAPQPGSGEVDFGRTVPAGGASILMLVGAEATERDLFKDWVLAHELFHLGVPSMPRDGRWLDEGLATYYEPVLRTRAGLMPERAMWAELRSNGARGVATREEPSLAAAEGHDRVYYGGSLFALAADVEIRRQTGGARSLDDGLRRALLEGASATLVWPVEDYIAALDRGAGGGVVRALYDRAVASRAPCGREMLLAGEGLGACAPDDAPVVIRMFEALGVKRGAYDRVSLDDTTELSHIRRSIGRLDEAVASAVAKSAPGAIAGAGSARAKAGVETP
ncbi:MAG: hypothetical protein R3F14_31320 [Polyangiaceae bacterium]